MEDGEGAELLEARGRHYSVENPIRRFFAGGRGRGHQLADRLEHDSEVFVVFLLQLVELAGQVFVGREDLAQADKSPHDGNVHFDGRFTAEDAGEHSNALFGECERPLAEAHRGARIGYRNLRFPILEFLDRKLKHEVFWKPADISSNLLIETPGRNPIHFGQVAVQYDVMATNMQDRPLNAGHWDQRIVLVHRRRPWSLKLTNCDLEHWFATVAPFQIGNHNL